MASRRWIFWVAWGAAGATIVVAAYCRVALWIEAHGPGLPTSLKAPINVPAIGIAVAIGAAAGLVVGGVFRIVFWCVRWLRKAPSE